MRRTLAVLFLLAAAACGEGPVQPDPTPAPPSSTPVVVPPPAPADPADPGTTTGAPLVTCTDGPQAAWPGWCDPKYGPDNCKPDSLPWPVQPALRYPSGACRLTWALWISDATECGLVPGKKTCQHLEADGTVVDFECGYHPGIRLIEFSNARGDGQIHMDEWTHVTVPTVCL